MDKKNYWDNRDAKSNLFSGLKRRILFTRWINIVYPFISIRFGDEKYIKDFMSGIKPSTVLDIACGSGKDILTYYSKECIGIDIDGYLKEEVLKKGYKAALVYSPPDYDFVINEPVDVITCINLNAHIPFESLEKILSTAFKYCHKESYIILISEFWGGISYERHFRNQERRQALVNQMEHYFFETEENFLNKVRGAFPQLTLVDRKPLTTLVSSIQYLYYYFKDRTFPGALYYFCDFLLSPVNYFLLKLRKKTRPAFLVGFIFKYTDTSHP